VMSSTSTCSYPYFGRLFLSKLDQLQREQDHDGAQKGINFDDVVERMKDDDDDESDDDNGDGKGKWIDVMATKKIVRNMIKDDVIKVVGGGEGKRKGGCSAGRGRGYKTVRP
jgi:hypothetical protein